jgi:putative intracellular protease/amidase
MKILMVLTSHDQLGDTGLKAGFWLEEGAAPYFAFRNAGVQLTLASPKGGQPPIDPKSDRPENQTPAQARFKKDGEAQKAFANTVWLADVKAEDFDTVFYPGGHGPVWDLAEAPCPSLCSNRSTTPVSQLHWSATLLASSAMLSTRASRW